MTLRLRLSLFISGVFGFLLGLLVLLAQQSSRLQAERHIRDLVQAAGNRIEVGVNEEHLPLRRLIHEEKGLSPQPLSLALYEKGKLVELVGHEPPADGSGWQVARSDFPGSHVLLGYPYHQTQLALHRQLLTLSTLATLAWLGLSGAAYWVVGQVLRPLHLLNLQAQRLSQQVERTTLKSPSSDVEFVDLVETLNDLLQQQERTTRQREQFYVAISHELRTPLQALSGHLELALMRQRSPGEYQTFLQECQRQTTRLTSLHEAILTLSQVDHGELKSESPYELAAFLAEFLPPRAKFRHTPTMSQAPRRLVELLVRNLVENAWRHGRDETPIQVELNPQRLRVVNTRRDDEVLDLHQLSQPFYRPESSRQKGGNGLGLALVRAIAERLGWRLELRCQGSQFEVILLFG